MDTQIDFFIPELDTMKTYPPLLYYKGDVELLRRAKIAIVGSRRPNPYTRATIYELSKKLSLSGMAIVSGAAIGVDAIAHEGAGSHNTIAVLPSGIDVRYPASNSHLIQSIEKNGLTLSQFEPGFKTREWSFIARNETVVALGEALIVAEADIGSGSMHSAEFALSMGKPIYVLPHRLRESAATRQLVREGKAMPIDDLDHFVAMITKKAHQAQNDSPFIAFCRNHPTYEEALNRFPGEIFEAELSGAIEVRNGRVSVVG